MEDPAPTPARFRAAMARFATGVCVMTTRTSAARHGMTANAVASVSLRPLLVLVCVERTTTMVDAVAEAGVFALSVLSARQVELSEHFADPERVRGDPQFENVPHDVLATGSPVLDGCVAALDCRVWASYDGGDHEIVVGEVVALRTAAADEDLLVYHRSSYGALAPPGAPRTGGRPQET